MGTVYCIGNGEVFLTWLEYVRYCKENKIPPAYDPPKPIRHVKQS